MPGLAHALETESADILGDWMKRLATSTTFRPGLIDEAALRAESRQFVDALQALARGAGDVAGGRSRASCCSTCSFPTLPASKCGTSSSPSGPSGPRS